MKSSIGKIRGGSCAIGNFTRCATFVWHIQKAYVLCGRTRSSRPRRRLNSRHQRHCYITIQHSSRNFRIQLPGRHDEEFDQLPQCRYGAPTPRYPGTHTVDPGLHPTPGVSTPHHPRLLKSCMSWTVRRTPIRGKPERFGPYRHCLDFRQFQTRSPPLYKPQIKSLSSLKTIQHLFPYFRTKRQSSEDVSWLSPMIDISALRQLVLFTERGHSSDLTENFINSVADTLEDLDRGCIILPSKLKPMPHLRILKRWIHLPTNGPPERTLNQLCDILTHCTTTSKVIERITINLLVVQMGIQELIHLDWSDVDDVFKTPPRMLKEFTLAVKYRGKPRQGKPVLRGDLQFALKTVMEQRMPNLTGMASAGPDAFKFSFSVL